MNHTPGPWHVEPPAASRPTWHVSDGSRAIAISIRSDANARLIAAAPDMLAALQAVLGRGYCEQRHPAGQDFVDKVAVAKVRAAIAKATG